MVDIARKDLTSLKTSKRDRWHTRNALKCAITQNSKIILFDKNELSKQSLILYEFGFLKILLEFYFLLHKKS